MKVKVFLCQNKNKQNKGIVRNKNLTTNREVHEVVEDYRDSQSRKHLGPVLVETSQVRRWDEGSLIPEKSPRDELTHIEINVKKVDNGYSKRVSRNFIVISHPRWIIHKLSFYFLHSRYLYKNNNDIKVVDYYGSYYQELIIKVSFFPEK